MQKQRVMFISSKAAAAEFKNCCSELVDEIEIVTIAKFGTKPAAETFGNIEKIMKLGGISWTIFHLPSVNDTFGAVVVFEELKNLIRQDAVKRAHTAVIDENEVYKPEVRALLAKAGIQVVTDPRDLGIPFSKMITPEEYAYRLAESQNPAFAGLSDYSDQDGRLPGMAATTPSTIGSFETDPFSEFEAAMVEDDDPFSAGTPVTSPGDAVSGDLFASSAPGATGTSPVPSDIGADPFAEIDMDIAGNASDPSPIVDDFAGFEVGAGGINGEFDDDALFAMLEQDIHDGGTSNADPFAGSENSLDNVPTGDEVFATGDPFADAIGNMFDGQPSGQMPPAVTPSQGSGVSTQVDVGSLIGGVGGVMNGSSVAEDVVGADPFAEVAGGAAPVSANPFDVAGYGGSGYGEDGTDSAAEDPFAIADHPLGADPFAADVAGSAGEDVLIPIDDDDAYDGDLFADGGNFDDPTISDDGFAGGYPEDGYGEGYDEYGMPFDGDGDVAYDEGYEDVGDASGVAGVLSQPNVSLSDVLDAIGHKLSDSDYAKMATMCEPVWDYSMEQADGIGQRGLFGRKTKGAISSSSEDELASSIYIEDMENLNGYYVHPTQCKVIASTATKGGVGKSCTNGTKLLYMRDGEIIWGTFGDVKAGDLVFNREGKPVKVLEVHPQPELLDVYEITLRDGRKIECSADHLWNVLQRGDHRFLDHHRKVLTTEQLMEKPIFKNEGRGKQEYRWKIPVNKALEMPERDLAEDPYLLGLRIGESTETELSIPADYLFASIEQRRSLLQGLMDSSGSSNRGRFSFSAPSAALAEQFMELSRSLGYVCSVSGEGRSQGRGTSATECWNIHLQTNDVENVFRLDEKKADFYEYQSKQTKRPTPPKRREPAEYGFNGKALLIDPYLIGALLSRKVCQDRPLKLTCKDDYIIKRTIEALPQGMVLMPEKLTNKHCKRDDSFIIENEDRSTEPFAVKTYLHKSLSEMGAYEEAAGRRRGGIRIPNEYLRATVEDREALLQGMCDYMAIFHSKSKCLPTFRIDADSFKQDLTDLLDGLGYDYGEFEEDGREYIYIKTDNAEVFGSSLLREKMHNIVDTIYDSKNGVWMGNANNYISITNIEKTDRKADMTCLLVDDEEHLFVAGDYIVTHNTTVSVGLASQLNWYFNQKLMQRLSTTYNVRVLLLSLNEFDDIPVHGVGYETAFSQENDTDGKNIAELLRKIDETGGAPEWDDIKHCFVSTERNRVFYLPSLTTREILTNDISLTAEDYKKVIECCKRFFQFVILDTPDIFYQQKNDIMNFAYSISDIICMIIEPDTRSTVNLMHFFDGLKSETGRIPLAPEKCLLVVNKVVKDGNPYINVPPVDQIPFERIATMLVDRYARFVAIPFTQPRGTGNVLFGTDKHVKLAFAELADDVLEMIDANDAREEQKKIARAKGR